MIDYICEKCSKEFTRRENLEYHISKNACKNRGYSCKSCNKTFSSKSSMYRHNRENCIIKKQHDAAKIEIFDRLIKLEENNKRLEEENTLLKREMRKMKSIDQTINNIYNSNDTNNTNNGLIINNNITLVGYGNEDMTKLDKSEVLKVLQTGYKSALKLTETVHFNPNYPEYHNIYISNMKDKYAMMFDGTNWMLTTKDDLINRIYDDKKNYIEENLDAFVDSLTTARKRALERWLNTDEDDPNDNPKIKQIKDSIKLLLYNKRNIACEDVKKRIKPNTKCLTIHN